MSKKKKFYWGKLVFSSLLLSVMNNSFAQEKPSSDLIKKMNSIGVIKNITNTPTPGMFAWTFEKNGRTLVLFNTPDNKFFIKGTIYDLNDKTIISDKYLLQSLDYASPEFKQKILNQRQKIQALPTNNSSTNQNESSLNIPKDGFLNQTWTKATPEALTLIDSLHGRKEGNGVPANTLYIFYDPTCTWCHASYNALRSYVKNYNATLKWIPTLARGKNANSSSLAVAALRSIDDFKMSFENPSSVSNLQPTKEEMAILDQNTAFLFAFSKKVLPDSGVSIPLGVFLNKQTGKITPQQGGLAEKEILDMLYGEKQ